MTRGRCWKYDWVLEFDIRGLFDNIDHTLLMRAVRKHVTCEWVLLYIERWLKAPMELEDGHGSKELEEPPKAEWSAQCWQICSCITRLTCGWHGAPGPPMVPVCR